MLSVIIPTLQEEAYLPLCLAALVPQAVDTGAEIIVVDGGSEDGTVALARRVPSARVLHAASGRARQMNFGARAARGSLLVFLPADTLLPTAALRSLAEIDRAGEPHSGGFRQRFDAPRPVLRCVSVLHNLRARLTGVLYGDQVPFVRRDLFLEMGGFLEGADMEDVEFGSRLKRRSRPRLLAAAVTTSSRRFDAAGDLAATLEVLRLLFHWNVLRRVPPSRTFFTPIR